MSDVAETLVQRGHKYGASFAVQCRVAQGIKSAMEDSVNWAELSADKKEALQMIATKMSRILNGDPEYKDSWHDISGYAQLIEHSIP